MIYWVMLLWAIVEVTLLLGDVIVDSNDTLGDVMADKEILHDVVADNNVSG